MSERWYRSLTHFEGIYSRVIMILLSQDQFGKKDQKT